MMRKTIYCCLCYLLFLALPVQAQELKVLSFKADESDISAVKFKVEDANGDACALVKVGLALPDATFEGDIVKQEYRDGEYWVYLIDGANWLNIKTKKYLPLRYEFAGVKKLTTYIMQIEKPQTAYEGPTGTVVITSNVRQADVYVDGEKLSSVTPFDYRGPEGQHTVELRAPGYNDERATINVKLNQRLRQQVTMKAAGSFQMDGISYEMINVSGTGSFLMGSPESIDKTYTVTGLRSFRIGKTEVTQALWQAVMGSNPSMNQGPELPVENVSWDDCQEFIGKLNEQQGTHFRLPTEAEWEYAARAAGATRAEDFAGSRSADDVANASGRTLPVGSRKPNALGICDMSGNVAEWCDDWWQSYASKQNTTARKTSFFRVVRGGSYADGDKQSRDHLRCYFRGKQKPADAKPTTGLRLAQDM